jgi:hypothetical protein
MILAALFYVFGAAVTGAWLVGMAGLGKDGFDRFAIALLILLWPLAWLFAAGAGLADVREHYE